MIKYIRGRQKLIDNKLKNLIPEANRFPSKIHQAMHYCIIGGKRIRPILCMVSCKICGGKEKDAITAACAIEMLHTYSLIHDDLPSMDNDDYRRGKPSCHRKFDEAIAILTGDAFLTLAYNILSEATKDANINNRIIKELSDATGTQGMIGGQVVDIEKSKIKNQKSKLLDLRTMEYIATHKTGSLIAASCKTGAIIAKRDVSETKEESVPIKGTFSPLVSETSLYTRKDEEAIFRYGEYVGFAFQIIDDMLDNEGLVKILGRKGAYNRARVLVNRAKEQLVIFKKDKKPLIDLADFILERKK